MNRDAPDRKTRIVIAEDHTLMAEGLRKLLETEFQSVTVVGNGQELLDTAAVLKPDVGLVDIVMPLLNGIEATRRLRKISPATKVVVLTAHNDLQYVIEAFRCRGDRLRVETLCAFRIGDRDSAGIGWANLPHAAGGRSRSRSPK